MRRALAWGLVGLLACGSDAKSTFDAGDEASDAAPSFSLRIDPASVSETVPLGVGGKVITLHALRRDAAGENDVTTQAAWSVDAPDVASILAGALVLQGVGGKTQIHATVAGVTASADLVVKATGSAFLGGTDPSAETAFTGATPDPNAQNAPAIEYPLDGVVMAANLPTIEYQWTQAADNNLYRVHVSAPDVLDAYFYTKQRELVPPAAMWSAIAKTVPDAQASARVEATGPSKLLRTSAPVAQTITADSIDDSAIYVWQSSTGTFRVIDMIKQKEIALPNNAGALGNGQPCSGCHRISRDGKRFSYTNSNFRFGALKFDDASKTFLEKIAPASYRGTYATFNPLESSQVPAMIVTQPDDVPQNTPGTVRLEVRDPDTNAVVPSNIAQMIAQLPKPNPGRATSMPDWSPDGTFVVFAAYDSDSHYVRLLGDDIVLASIVEAPVQWANGAFTFGAPKVLVAANTADDPDTGTNNLLPAISPDGSAVAFTRAKGWWSIKTQVSLLNLSGQITIVRRADGAILELKNGSPGAGVSSTWPQWAPTMGKRYAWLAYGSERSYGHELTPQNKSCGNLVQGQQSCKQLWVTAIDVQKLKSGVIDPSSAPFWIPGQSIHAQYVSPQWTKAVVPIPN